MFSASGVASRPVMTWPPAADYASALQAALTVTGALAARGRSGKGAYLDVSLSETMLSWQAFGLTASANDGLKRAENLLNGGAACYQVYPLGMDGSSPSVRWRRIFGLISVMLWSTPNGLPANTIRCHKRP